MRQAHVILLTVLVVLCLEIKGLSGNRHYLERYFSGATYRSRGHKAISHGENDIAKMEPILNSIYSDFESNKISQIFFLSPNYTVVQAQTRTTALLHCEVINIGNNTVTWKRRKDYRLLTFGLLTYSSDNRFFTRVGKNGKDWCLHIRYVNPEDAGLYECQVTSHPPASIFVDLQLVEAQAEIVGGPDKIVKSGSALRLSCVLRRSTEQPEYIFWYHGDRMINYNLVGGAAVRHGRQDSELYFPSAEPEHAGNYTCVPSNAHPVSVNVHILQSEKPAAMQHGSKNNTTTSTSSTKCWPVFLFINWLVYYSLR